jgi:hypothetical protein
MNESKVICMMDETDHLKKMSKDRFDIMRRLCSQKLYVLTQFLSCNSLRRSTIFQK